MTAREASAPAIPTVPTRRSVAVIGEALVDRFLEAEVVGGAPFNVARSLAAFGVPTTMITRIGADDEAGHRVLDSARAFGLPGQAIQRDTQRATGVVTVTELDGDHRFHIHRDAAWDQLAYGPARAVLQRLRPQMVYFGTLAQRSPVSAGSIRRLLDEASALRFLDLNLRDGQDNRELAQASLERADWLKLNEPELRNLLVWFAPQIDAAAPLDSAAWRAGLLQLMQRFRLARLIVTRGEQGYAAYDAHARCFARGPGLRLDRQVDSVGAGDAFAAAVIAGWAAGMAAGRALAGANRYAAAICGERGPLPQDPEFFRLWRRNLGLCDPPPACAAAA
ncbi:MAG: fructokinase [Rubrivivax sp.]|nr:fructokinase [Rubrivivax sp.]